MQLLPRVLTSWEVLGVTVVLVLYFFLVFYVARLYSRPKSFSMMSTPKKPAKSKTEAKAPAEPEVED
jgi:Na+-transporting methylmalonyl-CoA/oxaloacetate decarboxylase gamma subunit